MADLTKIYEAPVTAIGIAAAGTADNGSFTDLGALDGESSVLITWEPNLAPLNDGNQFQMNGLGKAVFNLLQTNPSGIQASLETYRTTMAKLKFTAIDTSEFLFIDNVVVSYKLTRSGKMGEPHKFEVTVSRITEQPDDFVAGPKVAA
jgi:hypothetical protein